MSTRFLALPVAFLMVGAALFAGEFEDLGDKFYARGNLELAQKWYRKAISSNLTKDSLWQKYDSVVKAMLLERGEVRSAAPPAVSLETVPSSHPAPASAPATPPQSTAAAPDGPTTAPAPVVQPPPPPAVPRRPDFLTYRPGERVSLTDPASPGTPAPPAQVEGGTYRVDTVDVGYDSSGAVEVRGRFTNTSSDFLHYPRIYVSIFDRQEVLRGRNAAKLPAGTTTLPPDQSTDFSVLFATYKGPVASYSIEATSSR